jgi:glyoxalase family protein
MHDSILSRDGHPHEHAGVLLAGPSLGEGAGALVLVHGRGGSARGIIGLAGALSADDFTTLAPSAAGGSWYPFSFLAPMEQNQPGLGSGLRVIDTLIGHALEAGVPSGRIVIGGFSQGACLALEYVARHPHRFGGVFGLSGGLIGPPGTPRDYPGTLEDTPVFLGCSDIDPHIPVQRVHETTETLTRMDARVDERIYPGMGHTVNDDELAAVRELLERVRARSTSEHTRSRPDDGPA